MRVTFEPMSAGAWAEWRTASMKGYAADMARTGTWSAAEAEARAAIEFDRLAQDGQASAGHQFCSVLDEHGQTIGSIWIAPDDAVGVGGLFVCDILIGAEFRGRGYGRATLEALEPLARSLGYDSIRLHVFGDNEVARNLYRSAGYVETDVSMLKSIG